MPKKEHEMDIKNICYDSYTDDDVKEFERLTAKDVFAVLIYNRHVYSYGKNTNIDDNNYLVRPEIRQNTVFAPASAFAALTGACVNDRSITVGNMTLEFKADNVAYKLNGRDGSFSHKPYSHLAHVYLPLIEAADILGLGGASLNDGRLTVVGDRSKIEKIVTQARKTPGIEFAGSMVVNGEYNTDSFTSADFKAAKDKWRELLVSTPERLDLCDPFVVEKITAINKSAKENLSTMHREEGRKMLWGDEPPTESWQLSDHYARLNSLALAYGTYGGELYHSETLKDDILAGLCWMYENMYGEAEIEGRGFRDINAFNWWNWYVDAPRWLTNVMLIMEEYLTVEEKHKYLKVFEYVVDRWRTGDEQDCCSGRLEVSPKCALLLEDKARLAKCAKDYHIMLKVALAGAGTHTDYVNYQHGFPLSMMYGLVNLTRVLKTAAVLSGTPLEFSSPRAYNLMKIQKLMYEAAMYRGRGFSCLYGRGCTGTENFPGCQAITEILPMIGFFGVEEDEYVRHFVKYSLSTDEQIEMAKSRCSLGNYSTLTDILNDSTVSSVNDYECAHAWFTADRATVHRNDFAFCVSMPSYRHQNYECINNGNRTGWYTNDGALYVYTNNDPHEFDGENFVLNERLAHRIPGTTVDTKRRAAVSISGGKSWKPTQDRVGCMQHEGKYVIAGMDYECYHRDENQVIEDRGYGGGLPKFISDLTAKKAYFMFDDECVCLGAGITSSKDEGVNTVVEHRRLIKTDSSKFATDEISVNGDILETAPFDMKFCKPKFARIENFSGFVFLDADNVSISKYMYEIPEGTYGMNIRVPEYAKGERPFAEIMINHGHNPHGATYAYCVLPYADNARLKEYSDNPDVTVISNTTSCQAVKEKTLGVTGIVFYEAGECAGIRVDAPCLVTFTEGEDVLKLSVCEPTNKNGMVRLEILKPMKLKECHRRFSVECGETVRVTFDASLSVGEAYTLTFGI